MTSDIILQTTAPTNYSQLSDTEGRLVLLPTAMVHQLLARGLSSIQLTVQLTPAGAPKAWLTVAEAARLHLSDVDGLTLHHAVVKVIRACDAGTIIAEGSGRKRRIEPNSLNTWRLSERERDLDTMDDA